MSGLEQAIKKALESADREDANQRARIYQSARNALDGGLAKQDITDPKLVARQRRLLDEIITEIEKDEAEKAREIKADQTKAENVSHALAFDDPFPVMRAPLAQAGGDGAYKQDLSSAFELDEPAAPHVDEPTARVDFLDTPAFSATPPTHEGFTEAKFAAERTPDDVVKRMDAPSFSAIDDITRSGDMREPTGKARKARRKPDQQSKNRAKSTAPNGRERPKLARRGRGIFALFFMFVVTLAFLLFGGWWVMQSDFSLDPTSRDTAVRNPSQSIETEDFDGVFNWATIFKPGQSNVITPGKSAQMQNVTLDGEAVVQIAALAPGDAGAVAIALPRTVLSMLETGPVLIEATVRAPQGSGQSVGIYCSDGTIEGCQRHRFIATGHKEALVVKLVPNGGTVPTRLLISSDLLGSGKSLDIYAIRARAAN